MDDVKRGDYIFTETNNSVLTEEVLARLEDLVWTRKVFTGGGVGPVNPVQEIEDLINFGWKRMPNPKTTGGEAE